MKTKISKSQWKQIGTEAGWMKNAQTDDSPKMFKWMVSFEVDAKHVAAGFEITDDMAKEMIANVLRTVPSDEFNAIVVVRPPASAIRLVRGY